jgi:organic radical activating enzyme
MLDQWYRKYFRQVNTAGDAKACVKEFKAAVGSRQIALYGAGVIGTMMRQLLEEFGIPAALVIDKLQSGPGIIGPGDIKALNTKDYLFLVVLDLTHLSGIKKELAELGVVIDLIAAVDFLWLLQNCSCILRAAKGGKMDFRLCNFCCARQPDCSAITAWQKKRGAVITGGEHHPYNGAIDFEIGSICSLRCKYCSVGAPYAKKKEFCPTAEIVRDMRRIYEAYPLLNRITISGGECMLHPDFLEILKQALLIFRNSILYVLSNGTAPLSEAMLAALGDERVVVQLSFYDNIPERQAALREENMAKLEKSGVACAVKKRQGWLKFYDPEEASSFIAPKARESDEEVLTRKFQSCMFFKTTCPAVCYGKYFLDPVDHLILWKNGVDVEGRPPLTEITNEELWHYNERLPRYLEACKYCIGPEFEMIPSGEQIGGTYESSV